MDSARGQVQHLGYIATFPLLLNISEQPTYFMAMKDAAGLVKLYAMVNVSQYQIVATGATVAECEGNYRKMLVNNGMIDPEGTSANISNGEETAGMIVEIRTAVIEGNTWYYFRLDSADTYYAISAADDRNVVILSEGDYVTIKFAESEGGILDAYSVAKTAVPAQ